MARSTSRPLRWLAALALCTAIVLLAMNWNDGEAPSVAAPAPTDGWDVAANERALAASARAGEDAADSEAPLSLSRSVPTGAQDIEWAAPLEEIPIADTGVVLELWIRLRDARGMHPVQATQVRLTLGELERTAEPTGAPGQYKATDLPMGAWIAEVAAPGYHAAKRTIDLSKSQGGQEIRVLDLFAFGDSIVLARPIDATALERMADELHRSLSDVLPWRYFSAWSASDGVGAAVERLASLAESLAPAHAGSAEGTLFQPLPPRAIDDTGRIAIGWLSLRGAASAWVEFRCGDAVLGRVLASADQAEITVDFDLDAVLARLPSLSMRIVDGAAGAPPGKPRVRLVAKPPAGTGPNFGGLPLAPDGEVSVRALEVGSYELVVTAPGRREIRREFSVEFGDALDLGVLVLESAAEMRVLVVDPHGRPLLSTLEAARYEPALSSEEAFLRATNQPAVGTGEFEVAAPAGRLLLRATVSPTADAPTANHHSQVVLVDPEQSPAELRIVVQEPVLVEISREEGEVGGRIRVVNEYDVRVVDTDRTTLLTYLPPGRYQAFALFGDGGEQSSQTFEVPPNSPPLTIRMP